MRRVVSVERRLWARRGAVGAVAGAALGGGAVLALRLSGSVAAAALVGAAALATAAAATRWHRPGAALGWLDRHADTDDLIPSGVAVADGRARRTALADAVVVQATARATRVARPSLAPAVAAGLLVAAALVAAAVVSRARPASASRAAVAAPRPQVVQATDDDDRRGDRAVATGGDARGAVGPGAPGAAPAPAAVLDPPTSSGGAGRGATAATGAAAGAGALAPLGLAPTEPVARVAGAPGAELATGAPRGGAAPALAAVPPRYRALVHAYLEAR